MSLIFVGGSQRSGTTMLQTLLCQDPSVNPLIREAKYFRHLVNAYAFGKQAYSHETSCYFNSEAEFDEFNSDLLKRFLAQTQSLFPNTQHLVLREPHLTMMFTHLHHLLPESKFLCIVRNPLDVIASMIVVGKKLEKNGIQDSMSKLFNSLDMQALSQHFLSFYQPLLNEKNDSFQQNLMCVRYEDLVSEPENSFNKVNTFTGLSVETMDEESSVDTGKIEYQKLNSYSNAWRSPLYEKAISNARIGTYSTVLNETQIQQIKAHCAEFMALFRYS